MKHIEVVAAIIRCNNKILCMQRGEGKYEYISYKYEFPGGKIEADELQSDALMRELIEEMSLKTYIDQNNYFMTINHTYPDFKITMHTYLINVENVSFKINEHIGYKWLEVDKLLGLDWAAADLPIVKKLILMEY